jgi:quercetin dioxygenase-like cupin family protein
MKSGFFSLQDKSGVLKDCQLNMYPSRLFKQSVSEMQYEQISSTYFGVVIDGEMQLSVGKLKYSLIKGMYFSCPGQMLLSGTGSCAVFERLGYRGLFQIGGPIEDHGRLTYIDNCRSTLLVHPNRLGDPCLNLLTFPPNVKQTMHIHPTMRLGAVISGEGFCLHEDQKASLNTGDIFYLEDAAPHCFHSGAKPLVVVAYHPDSDLGPTDAAHPMLSRTYTKF